MRVQIVVSRTEWGNSDRNPSAMACAFSRSPINSCPGASLILAFSVVGVCWTAAKISRPAFFHFQREEYTRERRILSW